MILRVPLCAALHDPDLLALALPSDTLWAGAECAIEFTRFPSPPEPDDPEKQLNRLFLEAADGCGDQERCHATCAAP
jgi:hypothetical protein